MSISNFAIEYDAINSRNTFTHGDVITGRIILEVSKETKVQALIFIAQGKARVCCVSGGVLDVPFLSSGTEVIGKGRHVFPFTFRIPNRKIPSSFTSCVGKIVHKLKAELKQSMKPTKKTKVHFTFRSKADMDIPGLMEPQYFCKDKSVKAFGSGNVSMDVHTKSMGYKQGEAVLVTLEVGNHSSRPVKPKFVLYQKKTYFAQGHKKVSTHDILKEKLEDITASSGNTTVTKEITIPRQLPPSILNCSIIKLEYKLKIYLDIKYATDPEIKIPIVVLPRVSVPKQQAATANLGFEAFRAPNQSPWSAGLEAASEDDPPPPYGAYALYPPVSDESKAAI
ncbi:arrestin domain-containing protein 3-like [Mugil cephalus]|uniref:arrestin domain-containing protein 3-like n=1 Tax=Mugil cephalus TaxID=48193 RepID=UPI001FB66887|nr:arrestin domain-containing protein 3-like [Mugil cephalus]